MGNSLGIVETGNSLQDHLKRGEGYISVLVYKKHS